MNGAGFILEFDFLVVKFVNDTQTDLVLFGTQRNICRHTHIQTNTLQKKAKRQKTDK